MTLRERAAAALDATHDPVIAYRGPVTMKLRDYVAEWLDGRKIRVTTIRKAVAYLEVVASKQ